MFKVGCTIFVFASFTTLFSAAEQCVLEEKDYAQNLAGAADLLSSGRVALLREEQVKKVNSIVDSLISSSTTQFLADCVPVGGVGQPTDRSCGAFKIAAGNAIRTRYFQNASNTKESIKDFCRSLTIVALDDFVGGKLERCADEMLHSLVTIDDHTSVGFLNHVFKSING